MRSLKLWEIIVLVVCIVLLITGIGLATWSVIRYFTAEEPAPTEAPPLASGEDWSRILESGKIIVGVSADYAPFEYYNAEYQIDGFDPALMREIGGKLGLNVEFVDYAFDGLPGALFLGQVDAAISAISVTPERESMVDFSSVYYVGTDAILMKEGTGIPTITQVDQLIPYRVGVQTGTIYEELIKDSLINTQKMNTNQLFIYPRIDDAVNDLKTGNIDLILLDAQPAITFVSQGGVSLAGTGLSQQRYAIAVRNGSTQFLEQINRSLLELNNEGRINELARMYLNLGPNETLPTPPPTATPAPNPIPTPVPPDCVDGMTFVEDLNLDAENMVSIPVLPPGQPFIKGWRVKNTGTCTWDSAYYLDYAHGNTPASRMGGQRTSVRGLVPPGATYDMYVEMVAPIQPGTYQGFWNMFNRNQVAFGQKVWVAIKVLASPTPTPMPTQTPSPSIEFSADRTTITAGEAVIFSWRVSGARQVYFYRQGLDYFNFPVASQGSQVEYPTITSVYELRVEFQDNRTEVRQIQITVSQPPSGAPVIRKFTLNPPDVIYQGQCIDLDWIVEGQVTRVRLVRNDTEIWGSAPQVGNTRDCPPGLGMVVYKLEANGPGGNSVLLDNVNILSQPATPVPSPTPAPSLPVVDYFTVNPIEVQVGNCVLLSWKASGGATRAILMRDGAVILQNAPLNGQAQDCLQKTGQVNYLYVAYNAQNQSAEAGVSVQVTSPPVTNPLPGSIWDLQAYFDGVGAMIQVDPNLGIDLQFSSNTSFNGYGGCNDFNGTYSSSGTSLVFDPNIQMTNRSCSQPVMDLESRYLQLLRTTAKFEVLGNQLNLFDGGNQMILQFKIGVEPFT